MQAETLNCPNCGAATSSDAPLCQFCGSRLATIACPSCFAMMFMGSKHCPRCGAAAAVPEVKDAKNRKCPRCHSEMSFVTIGTTAVLECERCLGLWLDVSSFEKVCADREQQSAVLSLFARAVWKLRAPETRRRFGKSAGACGSSKPLLIVRCQRPLDGRATTIID